MQTWLKELQKQREVNTPLPREAHTAASQWRKKKDMPTIRLSVSAMREENEARGKRLRGAFKFKVTLRR